MHDEEDQTIDYAVDDMGDDGSDGYDSADDVAESKVPAFKPMSAKELLQAEGNVQFVSLPVPPHRYTPLKEQWLEIYSPIVEHMKLQVRFNPKKRCVEMRVSHSLGWQLSHLPLLDFGTH